MPDNSSTGDGLSVRFASSNVNEDDGYAVVQTRVIPQVTSVRLYEETVEKVSLGHGGEFPTDLPSVIGAVGKALEDPTHVEKSYNQSYVYVDAQTTNASGDPFRVAVKVHSGTSGYVKSYYCANVENEPEILYRRGDATD